MAQDIKQYTHNFTADRDKRKPTIYEIEGAKMLRRITHEKLPHLVDFLQNTYFDICDNGISEEVSDKIKYNLFRYRNVLPNAYNTALNIHRVPKVKSGTQTMLDIHMNILRYSNNYEIKQKGMLSHKDVRCALEKVCEFYDFNIETVLGKSRKHEYIVVRGITALLCQPKTTLVTIGESLNREHSSIINLIKKVKVEMGNRPLLKQDYIKLRTITGL